MGLKKHPVSASTYMCFGANLKFSSSLTHPSLPLSPLVKPQHWDLMSYVLPGTRPLMMMSIRSSLMWWNHWSGRLPAHRRALKGEMVQKLLRKQMMRFESCMCYDMLICWQVASCLGANGSWTKKKHMFLEPDTREERLCIKALWTFKGGGQILLMC